MSECFYAFVFDGYKAQTMSFQTETSGNESVKEGDEKGKKGKGQLF
jgi:hypothetical protein